MRTVIAFAFAALLAVSCASAQTTWQLVWSDEFNGPAGMLPDPANWNYDLGGGGWGNNEAETYTNSANNVFQDGTGNLIIRAIRSNGQYTSARLQTGAPGASTQTADGKWQYGLIQARIKLPFGQGVWPAFWMLGEDINTVSWPQCGEVDIMENFGTFNNTRPSIMERRMARAIQAATASGLPPRCRLARRSMTTITSTRWYGRRTPCNGM